MDIDNIIKNRHSVRSYIDTPLDNQIKTKLENMIALVNTEGHLNIQLITDETKAFDTFLAHYGKFKNVRNYLVLVGKKDVDLEQRCGYYGQRIVLFAQELGLNTCWVGASYSKRKVPYTLKKDEQMVVSIALGYGETKGVTRTTRSLFDISLSTTDLPDWYCKGIEYALYAPSALNQQKYRFKLLENNVVELTTKKGFFTKVDMGIAKYHFELGAGLSNFKWK